MRSATEALGKDNPLNTPAAKQYQEMYDQQLAVSMSREGGGIGLADVLMRQMQKNKPVAAQAATLQGPAAAESAKKSRCRRKLPQAPRQRVRWAAPMASARCGRIAWLSPRLAPQRPTATTWS